ncbi:MAG TPA: hypothetical protein VGN34_33955 [Ktedonobacteraceae bacterium]
MIQNFEQGAREAGKDPSQMSHMIEINVGYGGNIEAEIQEQLKYWAGTYIPALFNQKIYTPAMSAENGAVIGADIVKKTGCFSNDAREQIQYVQQHLELGFDTIIVHSAGPDQKGFIESYARDILPQIRSAQARPAMAHTH